MLTKPVSYIAPYKPLPWQIEPWQDKSPILLLAGPAGTGKSPIAGEKLHAYLMKYPNATGVALRKTRESMGNSTVLFLERTVIGKDPRVRHFKDYHRFEYWNGSILAYGGMKDEQQREQIRGIGAEGNVDVAWMEEAVRFVEDDYNEVLGRMRGQAAPWQQVILSTNPGPPSHWINQRLILGGEASVYDKARPQDNPYNPKAYLEMLNRLTGILRQRLLDGLWVQAEGLVYSDFDLDNLTDEEQDFSSPFELGADDGYVGPRAILFIQQKPNCILVFDEIYDTRRLAKQSVKKVQEYCIQYSEVEKPDELDSWSLEQTAAWIREKEISYPDIAVISPDAKELQGAFREADIPARKGKNDILQGIAVVREQICDGNGYRMMKVNRRCKNFIRELTEGYVYPEGTTRRDSEKPADGNDHAADAYRYWAYTRT